MPAADAGAQDCEDDALSTATTLLLDGSKRPSTRHAESGEQDHHLPPSQSSVTMADMEDDADTYIFSHVPSRAGQGWLEFSTCFKMLRLHAPCPFVETASFKSPLLCSQALQRQPLRAQVMARPPWRVAQT